MNGFGSYSRQWEARPGGEVVALGDGVLVFGMLQEVEERHEATLGTTHYFTVQDQRRVNYGGLLAPGRYSDVTVVLSVTVAVVVRQNALPDVIGRDQQTISVQGQLSPLG